MATITEDYVSFEVAKLLKEKGFDERISMVYKSYGELGRLKKYDGICNSNYNDITKNYFEFTAPTLQMTMKWLREVHEIAIVIDCWFGGENYINWHGKIMCYGEELKTQQDVDMPYVATYEEACEAACIYALKNLI